MCFLILTRQNFFLKCHEGEAAGNLQGFNVMKCTSECMKYDNLSL